MGELVQAHKEGDALHLRPLVARLDVSCARDFKAQCERFWESGIRQVVVDMEKVGFVDSTAIGAFLSLYRKLPQDGGSIRLLRTAPAVQSVIEVLRLHRIFLLG
jgi:anti-sigma B factor antagonist